ncbi:hypothetical protein [Methanobacterium ferruginis]|uniref:hypothetical protein n=1 Tax=Methanobacterium ferruginis TaxID=710191 RepID=UPI002573FF14|nr:hypothetical protein [Methanobacterium ferruginis]BDZ66991.1 hypothetical protein GCM10025860_04390 [Methanobacterium ferruginis]
MESVEFNSCIDSKRKVLMSLYWVNKKVAMVEGCAPFYIEKVITENTIYLSDGYSPIKLSLVLLKDILKNIEANKKVKFEIKMGEEYISTSIHKNVFSVSTTRTKDLEIDIVEKLEVESEKSTRTCVQSLKQEWGFDNG